MAKITYQEVLEIFNNEIANKEISLTGRDNAGSLFEDLYAEILGTENNNGDISDLDGVELKTSVNKQSDKTNKVTLTSVALNNGATSNKILGNAIGWSTVTSQHKIEKSNKRKPYSLYTEIDETNGRIYFRVEDKETHESILSEEVFIPFRTLEQRIKEKLKTIVAAEYSISDDRETVIFTKANAYSYTMESFINDVRTGEIKFEIRVRRARSRGKGRRRSRSISIIAKTRLSKMHKI